MRVVYRGLGVVAAVAVVAVAAALVLPSRPDEVAARPIAAPSTVPSSSGPDSAAVTSATATGSPSVSPSASASASVPAGASASPSSSSAAGPAPAADGATPQAVELKPRATPSPGQSLAPGYTPMEALYADSRLPRLPQKVRRLKPVAATKSVIRDKRTGLAVPRLSKPWKAYGAAPFTSRQVLPKPRRGSQRGTLVSCPLPIAEQRSPRDTALLAARWTLNLHPKGSRVRWLASQAVKGGWMLVYQVQYGKHSSRAAVVVADGGMAKPGLTFVTVPDTQRNWWRDVTRVVSGVRVLS